MRNSNTDMVSEQTLTYEQAGPDITAMVEERVVQIRNEHRGSKTLPQGFSFDEEGWLVYDDPSSSAKSSRVQSPIRVCSHLEVVARTRDERGENHGRLLRFCDPDGMDHEWSMPMEMLAGDGMAFRQELLSKGLLIGPGSKPRTLLASYIQTVRPEQTMRCVGRTGWTDEQRVFVLPHKVIGREGSELPIFQATGLNTVYGISGQIDRWLELCSLSEGNSRMIFSLSAAFAPPLLSLVGAENCGFHLRGPSSSGKTTCLRLVASPWGGSDYVQSWRATVNGLEAVAAQLNDGILCLDEMAEIDPKDVGKVAYMLVNGEGKSRANRCGGARRRASWRNIVLSSGETGLDGHMAEAAQRTRAGQLVRILDIPADTGKYGCFENLHGYDSGQALADRITEVAAEHYGHSGPLYLQLLVNAGDSVLDFVIQSRKKFTENVLPSAASGQVRRACGAFSLVAVAGELAISLGILPWEEGTAVLAVQSCFEDWLHARGDCGPQEEKAALQRIKYFFEKYGESRFADWRESKDGQRSTISHRAGFLRSTEGTGFEYFVFPEVFRQEICAGFDYRVAERVCLAKGWLCPEKNGNPTRPERLPGMGKNTRVYRFTSKIFEEEANE